MPPAGKITACANTNTDFKYKYKFRFALTAIDADFTYDKNTVAKGYRQCHPQAQI